MQKIKDIAGADARICPRDQKNIAIKDDIRPSAKPSKTDFSEGRTSNHLGIQTEIVYSPSSLTISVYSTFASLAA